ncbi:MAG: hypothetical protein PGN07_04450 [Aeromicrobium erythreum]
MVNTYDPAPSRADLRTTALLIRTYVVLVLATLVVLALLSATDPVQAGSSAWTHMVIVAVFATILPLRLRSAAAGNVGGLRAVGIVASVLLLVNVVEALVPGAFPGWMRVEMVAVAALMALVVLLVVRIRLRSQASSGGRAR